MTYFKNIKSIEDVKEQFKQLAKKLHPDCGGDAEEFKKMMNEYRIVFDRYKNIHRKADGNTYKEEAEQEAHNAETADQFADIISKVIFMESVKVEIIGSWVWLTGNTYMYKDQIKAVGFWYSKSKKAWYYNGSTKKTKRKGHYTLEGIRNLHGNSS